MRALLATTCCALLLLLRTTTALPDEPRITYEMLYEQAVQAYTDERWAECHGLMLRAVDDWQYFSGVQVLCRRKCNAAADVGVEYPNDDVDNFRFFEHALRNAYCLLRCERQRFGGRPEGLDPAIMKKFQEREHYDYLQICAFKLGKIAEAVSYAYTFLMGNLGHDVMISNLQFYRSHADVTPDMFVDTLMDEYKKEFLNALEHYDTGNYELTASVLELVLTEYLQALGDCRLLCEGPYAERNDKYDMYIAISNHFLQTLRCKDACNARATAVYDKLYPELLSNIYHYLQYCYFKTGDHRNAGAAVESYLHLNPDDADMQFNKEFYVQTGADESYFVVRPEAVKFRRFRDHLARLLDYDEYTFSNIAVTIYDSDLGIDVSDTDDITWGALGADDAAVAADEQVKRADGPEEAPEEAAARRRRQEETQRDYGARGVHVEFTEKENNVSKRFLAGGFASEAECRQLVQLAEDGVQLGDGYRPDDPYIHSQSEQFAGMTPGRGYRLARDGAVTPEVVNLFLRLGEQVREFMESYFALRTRLYFTYTHLVCRTAVAGRQYDRGDDMSHPIHGDNCILKSDGSCAKEPPAYTWRDYSALLYLNDDFEGGDFVFADSRKHVIAQVKPHCGRVVSFSSGEENLHGVRAVTDGRRCAIAMWFTLDPRHDEIERVEAEREIASMLELARENERHSEL
ncbi:PREDICTED: prolyl 3-hydroxylase 2-like [Priapulus caudatus]|uniref:procollagen-proline 3-dioxygenase n=1 Tax=Priapulus caudatus TaxID=37621 RepID=A0ABM1E9Q3_PRICU|nr:PREDICTED: prolyl 3-hydroxylase 2-like [Priapulus caudatus]